MTARQEAGKLQAKTDQFGTGGGAISPYPFLSTLNAAQAGLRNWVHNLHNTLADQGIYAGVVAVNAMISDNAPDGYPAIASDALAQHYWDLHTQRSQTELVC
ncbi:hypothetical protein ACFLIM_47370 [Nonomuraea sp. M3C6]|uniref:Uncharacterized protein n=1 Tax=Nonomuraea marmarensis TaxID=3351344 RepID=A0ABW7ATP7_9ACTN